MIVAQNYKKRTVYGTYRAALASECKKILSVKSVLNSVPMVNVEMKYYSTVRAYDRNSKLNYA